MEGVSSPSLATNQSNKDPMLRKLFPLLETSICNKNLKYSVLVDLEGLTQVHPVVKGMFKGEIPKIPLAGRLKHFLPAWGKLSADREILSMVEGLKIPFISEPFQKKVPHQISFSPQQEKLVQQELATN